MGGRVRMRDAQQWMQCSTVGCCSMAKPTAPSALRAAHPASTPTSPPAPTHLRREQHREALLLAVCGAHHLAVHHGGLTSLSMRIAWPHSVHLDVCGAGAQGRRGGEEWGGAVMEPQLHAKRSP